MTSQPIAGCSVSSLPQHPTFNCVALSQTGDPTGAYYRWAFLVGGGNNFGDYPKYGVWPDAYYISTREFAGGNTFVGVGAYALDRAQMIAGNPNPTVISFLAPPSPAYVVGDGLLPADLDGATPPPAGSDEYYMGSEDDNGPYGAPSDNLTLWKFHADFVTPANSTFALTNTIPVAPFDSILALCGGGRACIPQPGTANKIDHLGYRQRPLFRLAYRNMGSYETLLTNQSVSAGTGPNGEVSGIRWWEVRSPASSPIVYQQGTYAPGITDGIHRWMGSLAMDHNGDIALGFSAGNATVFPSIYYTGRLAGDPLGQMPQGEAAIVNGTGSQTGGGSRWGDYTDMTVDPVDDCTFWYVNEYVPTTSAAGWRARIGAFKFPGCSAQGTPTATPTGIPPTATGTSTLAPTLSPTNVPTVTPTSTAACGLAAWVAGPTMTPGRYAIQGAVGTDGNVYVATGLDASSTPLPAQMARYNPGTNAWSDVAAPPVAVGEYAMGAASGKVYLAAGFLGGTTITSTLQIYDIATNSWSFGASLPAAVEAAAGTVLNGKLYVVGGDDFTVAVRTTYIYDIATNTWTTGPQIPDANGRTNTYGASASGKVYVWGGVYIQGGTNFPIDTLLIYDPGTNSWTTSPSANTGGLGNYGAVSTYGSGQLLVTDGGDGNFTAAATTHIYTISTNSWTSGPTMLGARLGHAQATLPDGRVFVYSGLVVGGSSPQVTETSELLTTPPCSTPTVTPTTVPPSDTPTSLPLTPTNPPPSPTDTPTTAAATQTPGGNTATPVPSDTPRPCHPPRPLVVIRLRPCHPTHLAPPRRPGVPTATPTACTLTFSDVPVGSTFYPFIRCLACKGIINGYPDGTFKPGNNVTRGQLSKIVSNSAGFSDNQTTQMFQDVPVGSTFYQYIGRLASRGFINGYPCGAPPAGQCVPPEQPTLLPAQR